MHHMNMRFDTRISGPANDKTFKDLYAENIDINAYPKNVNTILLHNTHTAKPKLLNK